MAELLFSTVVPWALTPEKPRACRFGIDFPVPLSGGGRFNSYAPHSASSFPLNKRLPRETVDCFFPPQLKTPILHTFSRTNSLQIGDASDITMSFANPDTMGANELTLIENIRDLDVAAQDDLLEFSWPFPLKLPGVNTTGVECVVLVMRRILRDMPADSHWRAMLFGNVDQAAYCKVQKDELDRTRALLQYVWHHLPDLEVQPGNAMLRLGVTERQKALLELIVPDHTVAQTRISFEALMESEGMMAAFWGTTELQLLQGVVAWQAKGEKEWQTKDRTATSRPVIWKLDQEPRLENNINKRFGLREVSGGNTSMLLPNWPKCLRVKMTTPTSVSMDKVLEQKALSLKGYKLLADVEANGNYRVSETQNEYRLIAAVALRPSVEHNDVVFTFDSEGSQIQSSLKNPVSYEAPLDALIMVTEAMLYFSRVDSEVLSISSGSESGDDLEDPDDKTFRQMLKELDPGAGTGLTPLSREAEQRLPRNIGPALEAAKERFFQ